MTLFSQPSSGAILLMAWPHFSSCIRFASCDRKKQEMLFHSETFIPVCCIFTFISSLSNIFQPMSLLSHSFSLCHLSLWNKALTWVCTCVCVYLLWGLSTVLFFFLIYWYSDASQCLNGKRVAVVGDSRMRDVFFQLRSRLSGSAFSSVNAKMVCGLFNVICKRLDMTLSIVYSLSVIIKNLPV